MSAIKILTMLCLSLFLSGCIGEDRSHCPRGERFVSFESVMEKYSMDDIADDMTLYLYDDRGELIFIRSYTVQEVAGKNYIIPMEQQKTGVYTLLASMNSGDDYLKPEALKLSGFSVSLLPDKENTVKRKQSDIHHGYSEIIFSETDRDQTVYDRVWLYKNTNHINITLIYNGYKITEEGVLNAEIHADNGAYDYRNRNLRENDRIYLPHVQQEFQDGMHCHFTVMHVKSSNSILFKLEEHGTQGELKASLRTDLLREIMKIYPTDKEMDQQDVFDIEIVLGDSMFIVELIVNGWHTIRDGVEL